jgi:hypothetical protein
LARAVLLLRDDADFLGRRGSGDAGHRGSLGVIGGERGGELLGRRGRIDVILAHRRLRVGAAGRFELRRLALELGARLRSLRPGVALHVDLRRRARVGRDVVGGRRQLVDRARHVARLGV